MSATISKQSFRADGLATTCPICGSWAKHPACPKCGSQPLLHSQIDERAWTCRSCSWASYDGGCEACFRLIGHDPDCPRGTS